MAGFSPLDRPLMDATFHCSSDNDASTQPHHVHVTFIELVANAQRHHYQNSDTPK